MKPPTSKVSIVLFGAGVAAWLVLVGYGMADAYESQPGWWPLVLVFFGLALCWQTAYESGWHAGRKSLSQQREGQ